MSGDANRDDPDNIVVWWFQVPQQATCAVSVFVPGTGNVMAIDQVRNQGRWVDAGGYQAPTGQLSVRLMTRGTDWGPGRAGAHLGVSAVRVTC
jgi:hypothetical protein